MEDIDIKELMKMQARRSPAARLGAGLAGIASGWTDPAGTFKTLMAQKASADTSPMDAMAMMMIQREYTKGEPKADFTEPIDPNKVSALSGVNDPNLIPKPTGTAFSPTGQAAVDVAKAKDLSPIKVEEGFNKTWVDTLGDKAGEGGRVITSLRNLNSELKLIDKKYGGTGTRTGVMADISKMKYTPSAIKDQYADVAGALGQEEEVPIGALRIMSGQARYVVDLATALRKTFPTVYNTKNQRENMLAQSTKNMTSLFVAIVNGYVTADKLREMGINPDAPFEGDGNTASKQAKIIMSGLKLSPEQEKLIDNSVKYVLDAPVAKTGREYIKSKKVQNIKNELANINQQLEALNGQSQ